MNTKAKKISEKEIDKLVVADANDLTKWTRPINVHPQKSIPIFITEKTGKKLQDAAMKRHVKNYHKWVEKIVKQHLAEHV